MTVERWAILVLLAHSGNTELYAHHVVFGLAFWAGVLALGFCWGWESYRAR